MEKRNKLILGLLIVTSLSSCGVFKSVFKSSKKTKENTEVTVNKEETSKIEDKSVTITKEKADTTIKTKPKSLEARSEPISNLEDIKNLTVLSSDLVTVRQTYDTLSKKLITTADIHSQNIDFKFDRITTKTNDIKTESNKKQDSIYKHEVKNKETIKQKEPKNIFWLVILGVGVAATFFYFTYRYFKNKL